MALQSADLSGLAATLRSRLSLQDAVILTAVLCAATLFAFEYRFFENVDQMTSRERRITVQEFLALTAFMIVGLIVFSFRRLQQQRREFEGRLVAEGASHEARHEARRDALTGLPNRRALLEAIAASHLDRAGSTGSHALLMLDLNDFKRVNDRYGHAVGDQVLETVARRMQSIIVGNNTVARLGGDEFAVFFPSIRDSDDIHQMAQRLIGGVEAPIEISRIQHRVGAGAGIALYPQDGRTKQELFHCADVALYRAKAKKRSAVRFYS